VRTLDDHTLKGYGKLLRVLAHKISLNDPNAVERHILGLQRKNKYKNNLLTAYSVYCKANGIEWVRPSRLRNEPCPIKVPTEERIDLVISCATPTYAMVFSLSKYGLRPDEVGKITLRDLDLGQRILAVRTSKLGYGRTLQLDARTVDKLRDYIARRKITRVDQRLFASGEKICDRWTLFRKRAFDKMRDPELLKIRLYDLRHWFGTTQYIKTRDIFHVKYLMGHRYIQSTLIYIHVAEGLVNYSEEYTVKVASTIDEFTTLLESGFEYVSDYEGKKILRKRK
jgi:integrase